MIQCFLTEFHCTKLENNWLGFVLGPKIFLSSPPNQLISFNMEIFPCPLQVNENACLVAILYSIVQPNYLFVWRRLQTCSVNIIYH